MDEEEDDVPTCPLCLEELDATDRAVKACQCGYQVCLWCLHTIRERLNGRCPACRTLYDEHNFQFDDVNPEQAAKEAKERKTAKKERERREKLKEIERERARALVLSQQKAKSNLKHARILQRNLVYIIGLSLTLAREEVIRRSDMFGKFGRIVRALVNRSHPFHADAPGGPSISAYVQYARDADAASAVRGMNNAVYDGREIRCAIATTKYCDSLVSNAQVGDPSATHHCGNAQCLYYHSTSHSDSVFTKEEALARQLGPPPPAHLFLPPATRRQPLAPSANRSSNAPPTVQSSRPLANRVAISATPASHSASSSSAAPPLVGPAQQTTSGSTTSSSLPLSNSSGLQALSSSPKATTSVSNISTRASGSRSLASSPKGSPLSPHSQQRGSNRQSRSPEQSSVINPSTSLPSPLASSSTSASLPSLAAWASTQPGHPLSRSPPPRPRVAIMESTSRSQPVAIPRRRTDAPPGFEDASVSRVFTSPSRPPGFESTSPRTPENVTSTSLDGNHKFADIPVSTSIREDVVPSSTSAKLPVSTASSTVDLPPPGFGASLPTSETEEKVRDEVAAAWSHEASGDEVFSLSERRNVSAVGEVGARMQSVAGKGIQPRADVEEVLASIGGTLGVSSEFHRIRSPISSSNEVFDSDDLREHGRRHTVLSNLNSNTPSLKMFEAPETISKAHGTGPEDVYGESNIEVLGHAIPSRAQSATRRDGLQFRHSSVPSGLGKSLPRVAQTAAALRTMRNQSRFEFAQGGQLGEFSGESVSHSYRSRMLTSKNGLSGPSRALKGTNVSAHHDVVCKGLSTSEFSDIAASAKSNLNGRQARSRFDFADHAISPSNAPEMPRNIESNSSAVRTRHGPVPRSGFGGASMTGTNGPVDRQGEPHSVSERYEAEDIFEDFHHLSTAEKLASIFTSAKRATESLPPMPQYNPHLEGMMHRVGPATNTSIRLTRDSGNRSHGTGSALSIGASDGYGGRVIGKVKNTVSEKRESVGGSIGGNVELPPPGFKEATSGTSPDTTAGNQTSAITGVATKVVSGGTGKGLHRGISGAVNGSNRDSTGVSGDKNNSAGDDVASSEAESLEDDRKRSRSQRKRDRKARQIREASERKVVRENQSDGSISVSDGGGNNVGMKRSLDDNTAERGKKATGAAGTSGATKAKRAGTSSSDEHSNKKMSSGNSGFSSVATRNESEVISKRKAGLDSVNGDLKLDRSKSEDMDICAVKDGVSSNLSVSELEREVEAARVREAQLQDKLTEINRRLRSYDNVRT